MRLVQCDVNLLLLRDAMHCAYVCGTCLWNFLLEKQPRNTRNTVKLFMKLLAWMGSLQNREEELERVQLFKRLLIFIDESLSAENHIRLSHFAYNKNEQ